jgi:ribulose-phosphate 3-epimerase
MTDKIFIAPSILASDFSKLGEEVRMMELAGADYIHIDVMDGNFVPNITVGIPVVKSLRKCTTLPLDVHLMIQHPEHYIEAFSEAGADVITVHAEACVHLHKIIEQIKKNGKKTGVSLNPATSLEVLRYVLDSLDMVLLMSVNPGFGGQEFIPETLIKIRDLRNMNRRIDIEVDGGITDITIQDCIKAGANIFVAGSFAFSGDYQEQIAKLKKCEMPKR